MLEDSWIVNGVLLPIFIWVWCIYKVLLTSLSLLRRLTVPHSFLSFFFFSEMLYNPYSYQTLEGLCSDLWSSITSLRRLPFHKGWILDLYYFVSSHFHCLRLCISEVLNKWYRRNSPSKPPTHGVFTLLFCYYLFWILTLIPKIKFSPFPRSLTVTCSGFLF